MSGKSRNATDIVPGKARPHDDMVSNAWIIAAIGLMTLGTSLFIAFLHFEGHVSVYRLISDPAPFVGMPWYFGSLSQAGVLIWIASASVCAFAARLLWNSGALDQRRLSRLLTILGAGSLWMALDDLLLIHEQLGRLMFDQESRHTGEALVFGAYALMMLGCLVRYRECVEQTEVAILFAALLSLAASVAIDTVLQLDIGGNNFILEIVLSRSWGGPTIDIIEDLLKLNGGMLMLAYFARTGIVAIQREMVPLTVRDVDAVGDSLEQKRRRGSARH
jgi:hypothetical protein